MITYSLHLTLQLKNTERTYNKKSSKKDKKQILSKNDSFWHKNGKLILKITVHLIKNENKFYFYSLNLRQFN